MLHALPAVACLEFHLQPQLECAYAEFLALHYRAALAPQTGPVPELLPAGQMPTYRLALDKKYWFSGRPLVEGVGARHPKLFPLLGRFSFSFGQAVAAGPLGHVEQH